MKRLSIGLVLVFACSGFLVSKRARADQLYGSIRGVITDPSGAVIPGATVIATDVNTGIHRQLTTSADGSFEFLNLLVPATYNIRIEKSGFQTHISRNIVLNINQVYVVDAVLRVGAPTQQVTVRANPAQVESTSMERGTLINGRLIVDLPLNGRNWVQLQQLEPGVVAASDDKSNNYATNGSQPEQNSYLINGTDDNDLPLNTVQVIPSPDAIAEFKMVTSTINPEYGRNSGAILNAIIKSGTNQFHGDGFEFYRDTSLNARNFFQPAPAVFHRNQFGGTIGGPIWKDHTFFFFSYQGTRETQPEASGDCGCPTPGAVPVFSQAQRSGAFPDLATSTKSSPFPLVGDNGQTYPAGTPYASIFSQGIIPQADFNKISSGLLSKYVPPPTVGTRYEFNPSLAAIDDQYLTRIDQTFSSKDAVWGYFLWERNPDSQAVPFTGATLPGFGQVDKTHWQQYTAAWNHTFNGTTLNEARIGYTRLNFASVFPQAPMSPSSAGFTGINPQLTSGEGLPVVNVLGYFDLGFSTNGPQPRIDQTYQATDNFSKMVGRHTLKFGFDVRRFEVYNPASHNNDGVFNFNGGGMYSTGDPAADFLLGIPDNYSQGSGDIQNERTQEYYSYAQDQWKVRPDLTLTYGVGWSIDTPNVDNYHDDHAGVAFRPGQQSIVFPTAPAGYLFQGDPGVEAFGRTAWKDFGPRFGFAYTPNWGWLTGGGNNTSIRAGFGIYFNRSNGETTNQTMGLPPFALNSSGVTDANATNPALPALSPSFANPFVDVAGHYSLPNKFPYVPSRTPNFSLYYPIEISVYDPNISIPYAENFNLTLDRQLDASTIFSLGYVGASGHRLLLASELNPGINPAGCAATPECVDNPGYQPLLFPGNYKYPANIFASIGDVETVGNSNYNSFQASLNKHFSHGFEFLAAYTWSHAMDDASGYENSGFGGSGSGGFGQLRSINPFNREAADYGPSIYDATHRLVISYVYQMPSVRRFHAFARMPRRLTDGWQISGITTFQSGSSLDVVDSAFPSLTSSYYTYYTYAGGAAWDVPNAIAAPKYLNPRSNPTNLWFSSSTFGAPTPGTEGNAGRNILRGPGINNFDFALEKDTRITERTRIELRFEFFNLFNHTQFDPAGITTDFNSPAFGTEAAAFDPRLIQLGAKLYF
ncbi:MAG: carboxypeptidase regulatory-like domain-containing protein [Terriglobia bacterium]